MVEQPTKTTYIGGQNGVDTDGKVVGPQVNLVRDIGRHREQHRAAPLDLDLVRPASESAVLEENGDDHAVRRHLDRRSNVVTCLGGRHSCVALGVTAAG